MDKERRIFDRHTTWFPIQARSAEDDRRAMAVAHNASSTGVMVGCTTRFAVGDILRLRFRLTGKEHWHDALGIVVRCDQDDSEPDAMWPHRAAIRFVDAIDALAVNEAA